MTRGYEGGCRAGPFVDARIRPPGPGSWAVSARVSSGWSGRVDFAAFAPRRRPDKRGRTTETTGHRSGTRRHRGAGSRTDTRRIPSTPPSPRDPRTPHRSTRRRARHTRPAPGTTRTAPRTGPCLGDTTAPSRATRDAACGLVARDAGPEHRNRRHLDHPFPEQRPSPRSATRGATPGAHDRTLAGGYDTARDTRSPYAPDPGRSLVDHGRSASDPRHLSR